MINDEFKSGIIWGRKYIMEKDEVVNTHSHTEGMSHLSIVSKGSFQVVGDYDMIMKPGDYMEWPPDKLHGFIALEDNSILLQLYSYPEPAPDPEIYYG